MPSKTGVAPYALGAWRGGGRGEGVARGAGGGECGARGAARLVAGLRHRVRLGHPLAAAGKGARPAAPCVRRRARGPRRRAQRMRGPFGVRGRERARSAVRASCAGRREESARPRRGAAAAPGRRGAPARLGQSRGWRADGRGRAPLLEQLGAAAQTTAAGGGRGGRGGADGRRGSGAAVAAGCSLCDGPLRARRGSRRSRAPAGALCSHQSRSPDAIVARLAARTNRAAPVALPG